MRTAALGIAAFLACCLVIGLVTSRAGERGYWLLALAWCAAFVWVMEASQ